MSVPLASFDAAVSFAGPCVFSGAILVEQLRDDADPPLSFDLDLTFDREMWDAVTARTRWTGAIVEFDGEEIVIGRIPSVKFEESMPPGSTQQATMDFQPIGDRWSIPSGDYIPPTPATCPVTPPATVTKSPKMYGNKPTSLALLLGASPANMKSIRLFQGQSSGKSNKGNVAVSGDISCVDDSALFVNKPICYQLGPFAGKRRDEIIREIVEQNVFGSVIEDAFVPLNVICPVGKEVTKPLLLTNASLMQFLNDFIAAENWFASFDENGALWIRRIELKEDPYPPDWTLDEALGDFDFDSMTEQPPDQPPTRFIVSVAQPVRGTGPGGSSLTITTRTIQEDQEFYNPECVKVRPSGGASHLLGDGTYHTQAAETMMLVSRKVTDVTTVDGLEVKRVVTQELFYNPNAYDPNFNTLPRGTNYNGAYGGKSFHRDEAESLMVVSEFSLETKRDIYGTILGTIQTTKGWYSPYRGAAYSDSTRTAILNRHTLTPPAYVYAGGTTRSQPAETYGILEKIEKDYFFDGNGALASVNELATSYYAADSRCDLLNIVIDDAPPIENPDAPPLEEPPTPPPPPPPTPIPAPIPGPTWHPVLTGPIRVITTAPDLKTIVFRIGVANGPSGAASISATFNSTEQSIPMYGVGSQSYVVPGSYWDHVPTLDAENQTEGEIFLHVSVGPNGAAYGVIHPDSFVPGTQFYASVVVSIGGLSRATNNITFDPFTV